MRRFFANAQNDGEVAWRFFAYAQNDGEGIRRFLNTCSKKCTFGMTKYILHFFNLYLQFAEKLCGPVAQLGARLHGMQEVTGSNPVRSTK